MSLKIGQNKRDKTKLDNATMITNDIHRQVTLTTKISLKKTHTHSK